MDVIIVGAGPSGLTLGAALARRGYRVVAVDRDPGPAPDGSWRRRGVMQFQQAHGFRPQVRDLLLAEWPEAWHAWLDLGAEPIDLSATGGSAPAVGVRSRRVTYERALRRAAAEADGLTVAVGHVDGLAERGGRVVGDAAGPHPDRWSAGAGGGQVDRLRPEVEPRVPRLGPLGEQQVAHLRAEPVRLLELHHAPAPPRAVRCRAGVPVDRHDPMAAPGEGRTEGQARGSGADDEDVHGSITRYTDDVFITLAVSSSRRVGLAELRA